MAILIILLVIFFILFIKLKFKRLKVPSVLLITGTIGGGKTSFAVHQSIKLHKREHFKWAIKKFFGKLEEEPLLYSNIPLKYKYYVPLVKDEILRNKRFAFKSVILWSEASLILDSQNYKNEDINANASLFIKLIRHSTHGGYLICETQGISDLHYSIKRVLTNYLYIHRCVKWIPFILIFKVREMAYSYDNQGVMNVYNSDLEDTSKTLIVSKSIWKKYDTYTFSKFTDSLDYDFVLLSKSDLEKLDLKSDDIVSFNNLKVGANNEQ